MTGKERRLRRLLGSDSRAVLVPMDHGMTLGPIPGLDDFETTASQVVEAGVDAIIVHKGIAHHLGDLEPHGLILHASASTALGNHSLRKVVVASVQEALRMGADAISTHLNVGSEHESEQIADIAAIARACEEWQLPLLVMTYARGTGIGEYDPRAVAHAVRVAVELGADMVKCNFPDDVDAFHRMVDLCPVQVIVAGGPRMETTYELFRQIARAMDAGAAGVAVGRNIFGHPYPGVVARQIVRLVHAGISAEEAEDALLVQTAAGLFENRVRVSR